MSHMKLAWVIGRSYVGNCCYQAGFSLAWLVPDGLYVKEGEQSSLDHLGWEGCADLMTTATLLETTTGPLMARTVLMNGAGVTHGTIWPLIHMTWRQQNGTRCVTSHWQCGRCLTVSAPHRFVPADFYTHPNAGYGLHRPMGMPSEAPVGLVRPARRGGGRCVGHWTLDGSYVRCREPCEGCMGRRDPDGSRTYGGPGYNDDPPLDSPTSPVRLMSPLDVDAAPSESEDDDEARDGGRGSEAENEEADVESVATGRSTPELRALAVENHADDDNAASRLSRLINALAEIARQGDMAAACPTSTTAEVVNISDEDDDMAV
ncbi:uncharacterized protein [Syngnathus scovelli]|uniref:uncharacterized protein n=1 Tax=Syngnathus scovelli TaxID=161590 RepID=UPI0021102300|nr:uncharacterized protein LOC125974001 [Syngnathus scovelli]